MKHVFLFALSAFLCGQLSAAETRPRRRRRSSINSGETACATRALTPPRRSVPRKRSVDVVVAIKQSVPPRVSHASHSRELGPGQEPRHLFIPVPIEDAVVIGEQKVFDASLKGLLDGDVSGSGGSPVLLQGKHRPSVGSRLRRWAARLICCVWFWCA